MEEARNEAKPLNWLPMNAEVMYGQRAHDTVVDDILARDSKKGKQLYPAADQLPEAVERTHRRTARVFVPDFHPEERQPECFRASRWIPVSGSGAAHRSEAEAQSALRAGA